MCVCVCVYVCIAYITNLLHKIVHYYKTVMWIHYAIIFCVLFQLRILHNVISENLTSTANCFMQRVEVGVPYDFLPC